MSCGVRCHAKKEYRCVVLTSNFCRHYETLKNTNPQGIIVRRGLRAIHRAQQASIAGAVHQDARHVREASTKTTVAPAGATRVLAVIIVPQVPRRITRVLEDIIVHLALRGTTLVQRGKASRNERVSLHSPDFKFLP